MSEQGKAIETANAIDSTVTGYIEDVFRPLRQFSVLLDELRAESDGGLDPIYSEKFVDALADVYGSLSRQAEKRMDRLFSRMFQDVGHIPIDLRLKTKNLHEVGEILSVRLQEADEE